MGAHNNRPESDWKIQRDNSFQELLKKKEAEKKKVVPLTKNQEKYMRAIDSSKAVVCTGPAGTGKTYMACWKAVEMLKTGRVKKIILTRPLQECGEEMGFMPGDAWEKTVDMMAPLLESLDEFLGHGELEEMRKNGTLLVVPLAKMRGRTIKNSIIILDEAQNASFKQIKMFVTRFGSKAKMIVCGDHTQSDLPYAGMNSLYETVLRFKSDLHRSVSVIEMKREDIVRDELVRWFDEVLSKDFNPAWEKGFENKKEGCVPCPCCEKSLWYNEKEFDNNLLVRCENCYEYVELKDADGKLDPIVIENPEPEDFN